MKRNGIIFITILFLTTCIFSLFTAVQAATDSMYLNIKLLRGSGYGYKLASSNKNVWKIYETDGRGNDKGLNSTIYCLKGGPGFGSSDYVAATPQETHYTQYFNLKDPNSITPDQYINVLPDTSSKEYKALLWILDNCYVAPKTNPTTEEADRAVQDKKNLLNAVVAYAEEVNNPDVTISELELLTDDDIDAVQQLAVWYYTNPEGDLYHVTNIEFWLNTVQGTEDSTYKSLINFGDDGWDRANACQALFDYLVQTPQKADFIYTIDDSTITQSPIKIANTDAKIVKDGNSYIVGPLKLEKQGNISYSFNAEFLDQNNNEVSNITLLNLNKEQTDATLQELVGQNFYVSIPTSTNIESIELAISGSYTTTKSTYWSVENPDSTKDQPVVKVEKSKVDFNDSKTVIKEAEKYFDLALRKFITAINNKEITNREPQVILDSLKNEISTTAIYNHPKNPENVYNGDIVTYTIRVYNEGQLDGYVTEITDYLPQQLEFIVDDELNAKYGWILSEDGRTVKTNITSSITTSFASRDQIYKDRTNNTDKVLLKAFDGNVLDYIDVKIKCKVKDNISLYEKITNIADITGFTDKNGNAIIDRDSQKSNVVLPTDKTLPEYKDTEIERGDTYVVGQQDDDDFEKLILKKFDLALRKFITGVNEEEITSRAPVFTKTSGSKYEYVHPKDPVDVANGNTVIYTLRIFNEGNVAGYAEEIKDNLPEGLEFLPENTINTVFKWKMYKEDGTETTDVKEAKYIKTNYLSKENETVEGNNLLKAFDPETMTMPDYKDIKIAFKVTELNTSDRIIINTAEIVDDADEDGNEVDDIDSTPDNNISEEDDQDIEKIKVKYFDLALKKWVTESIVTYNGKTTITKTGHTGDENLESPAKVEIRSDRINKTTVKFKFSIKVTNEGEIEGYVKELIDYIPEGLKFNAEDNPKWRLTDDGKVLTDQLKDVLIKPGESQIVEIILTWINGKDNMGLKTNWAEIYEDYNEHNSPDIDSTPGNNEKEEDDIDEAPVIITTATGNAPTYATLALVSISMIAVGIVLIKRYVI